MDSVAQSAPQVWEFIRDGGFLGVLFVVLWGGYKKWWVFGHHYQREVDRADKWERLALKGTDLAEAGNDIASSLAQAVQEVITRQSKVRREGDPS